MADSINGRNSAVVDSIQRLNYHDGLFLQAEDFQLEQRYHRAIRRRVNYVLFTAGILYGLELVYDGSGKVTIRPGIAVDRYDAEMVGREILITEDAEVAISEDSFIVLSYAEETRSRDVKPISDEPTPARVTEIARIDAVSTKPSDNECDLKIVLGKISKGVPLADSIPERQLARIRSELLPTGIPLPQAVRSEPI